VHSHTRDHPSHTRAVRGEEGPYQPPPSPSSLKPHASHHTRPFTASRLRRARQQRVSKYCREWNRPKSSRTVHSLGHEYYCSSHSQRALLERSICSASRPVLGSRPGPL
jgi:hypothetical protein